MINLQFFSAQSMSGKRGICCIGEPLPAAEPEVGRSSGTLAHSPFILHVELEELAGLIGSSRVT